MPVGKTKRKRASHSAETPQVTRLQKELTKARKQFRCSKSSPKKGPSSC